MWIFLCVCAVCITVLLRQLAARPLTAWEAYSDAYESYRSALFHWNPGEPEPVPPIPPSDETR